MKKILLLFAVAASFAAKAQNNALAQQVDSSRYALLKPHLENYLSDAAFLTAKIQDATQKDSVRYYAKQLRKATDRLVDDADMIYGHRDFSGVATGMTYIAASKTYVPTVIPYYVSTGPTPPLSYALNKIGNHADCIHWFAKSKTKQLSKISRQLDQLKNS